MATSTETLPDDAVDVHAAPPTHVDQLPADAVDASSFVPKDASQLPSDVIPVGKEPLITTAEIKDAVDTDVNFLKGAWDKTKDVAGKVSEGLKQTLPGNVYDLGADVLKAGAGTGKAILNVAGSAFDKVNRVAGTGLAKVIDLDTAIDATNPSLVAEAEKRQLISGEDHSLFNRTFPVRLVEDFGDVAKNAITGIGENIEKSSTDPNLKEAGKFLQYVAPAAGIVGGLMLFDKLPAPSFGQLTEAGIEAEKSGKLASSFPEQLEQGHRSIAALSSGGETISTGFGRVGKQVANKAANLSVSFDASLAGRALSKISTDTSYPEFNVARDDFNLARNQNQAIVKKFTRGLDTKAEILGIDLGDPEVTRKLTKALDTPSQFAKEFGADKAENFFNYANGEVQKAVVNAAKNGIVIPMKSFAPALSEAEGLDVATLSERYVPRYATPDKVAEYKRALDVKDTLNASERAELVGIADEYTAAEKAAKDLGAKGAGSGLGNFLKNRDLRNTASMNAMIEDKLGIKDFFTTDISRAYAEKINNINQTVIEKNFVQNIRNQFATSTEELIEKKVTAQERIAEAIRNNTAVNPTDIRISNLKRDDLVGYGSFPESLRNKLDKLSEISPDTLGNIKGLRVPREVMDHMVENLAPQKQHLLVAGALTTQNMFKAFMTSNPGFYVRNWFQSFTMGGAAGVNTADNIKSFAGLVNESGPWAERKELFESLKHGYGAYGKIEESASSVSNLQKLSRVEATVEDLAGDSALKRLWTNFRQMAGTDAWKGWLSELKNSGVSSVRENPIFKVASTIGKGGEEIPQFAYFNKLMDEGYNAEQAMLKTNKQFLNFENTRDAIKKASMFFPFANHAIKNAEVTMRILAQSPKNAMYWGRNGAFQRAIENWAGWNPDNAQKTREMFDRGWTEDQIYLGVMPNESYKALDQNKDLLKTILYKVYGSAPNASQMTLSLPSNIHALSMWDPTHIDEMTGPFVKSGISLLGTDPFTGKEYVANNTYNETQSKLSKVADQFLDPMIPKTTINIAKGMMDKLHSQWADNAAKLGADDTAAKVLFPKTEQELQRAQKDVSKALVKATTLWRGSYTQLDQDLGMRIMGKIKDMQKAKSLFFSSERSGKEGLKAIEEFKKGYIEDARQIQEWTHIKEDYEQMLQKVGAPGVQIIPKEMPSDAQQIGGIK